MTDEEKIAIVDERKPKISRYIIDHSVGIIAHDDVKPLEHGTGILLQLEEEPVVLTAAHVVAKYQPSQLQFCATETPSNVKVAPREKVAIGGGGLELLDIAFLRLSPQALAGMSERKFFTLEDIEVFPKKLDSDLAIFSGFPEEDHEVEGVNVHRYGLYTYFPNTLDEVDWFAEDGRQKHFTLEYPRETVDAFTKKTVSLLDPAGMSGGGTWRCRFNEAKPWEPTAIRLIGLNVEVMEGYDVDFIRSIHMEPVLAFLGDHFPSAKRYLEKAREELERRRG